MTKPFDEVAKGLRGGLKLTALSRHWLGFD